MNAVPWVQPAQCSQRPKEPIKALVWREPSLLHTNIFDQSTSGRTSTIHVEPPLIVLPWGTPQYCVELSCQEPFPPFRKFLAHKPSSTAPTLLSNNQVPAWPQRMTYRPHLSGGSLQFLAHFIAGFSCTNMTHFIAGRVTRL